MEKKNALIERSRIGMKGQVVIPAKLRRRYKLKNKSEVCFIEKDDCIMLIPLSEDFFSKLPDKTSTGGEVWKDYLDYKKEEKRMER